MATDHSRQARFVATGRAQVVDEHDQALWDALIAQVMGGKGFRPLVLERTYQALGGRHHQVARAAADAVELLHTAFVVHDDVIDGDDRRRGQPNVGGIFAERAAAVGASADKARRYGNSAGILAGDLALAGAVRGMALCGAPPGVVARLLDLVEEVLHRSAAGELADVRVSLTADASLSAALQVAEWKTAAYTFQLPLQAAAILAEADDAVLAVLGRIGRQLGIAYQLSDDLQGVFGTQEETGKDPLGDLREGKSTALIAIARSSRHWAELAPHIGDPGLTVRDARRARELLVACGARRAVDLLVQEHREAAVVAATTLPSPVADTLIGIIDLLVPAPRRESRSSSNDLADASVTGAGVP